jgi:hypothetical protein
MTSLGRGAVAPVAARRLDPLPVPPAPRRRLPAGWPLIALIMGFPLWWALGLGSFAYTIAAIPMALYLIRTRPLRYPPGFALWVLFLVWVVAGFAMLGLTAPGTVPGPASGRLIGYFTRLLGYISITVMLLYVGNLPTRAMSNVRLVRMLGFLGLVTVAGGLLGMAKPSFNFTSPVERLLPASLSENSHLQNVVHPAASQLQDVLGYTSARPKAPFEYTNAWGQNLSLLLICLVIGWWVMGRRWHRWVAGFALLAAAVPIVYSLNRGLWLGIGLSLAYVAFRVAASGRLAMLGILAGVVAIGGVLFVASSLQTIVEQRLAYGHSNQTRQTASLAAVEAAASSPILGYGTTRYTEGSAQSITAGRSIECPKCGMVVGGNGQLWLMLISHGFVGAGLYIAFFVTSIWRYRHDRSPYGIGGILALCLALVYMFVYQALPSPLGIYFLIIGLLWRNHMDRSAEAPARVQPRSQGGFESRPHSSPRATVGVS